jgi:invasion protein IalB
MDDKMRTQLTRGGIALGLLVVGLIAGWIGGVATAHDGAAKIEVYKDWRLACPSDEDKKGSCALASDIADPSSGEHLAQITMGTQADKPAQQVMVVTVPLTVLIQPGLGIQVGSDTKTVPFATCVPSGCVATMLLDDKVLDSMRDAPTMGLVVTAGNGRSINLPISIQGYKAAISTMNWSEARRHSWWRRLWS